MLSEPQLTTVTLIELQDQISVNNAIANAGGTFAGIRTCWDAAFVQMAKHYESADTD